MYNVFNHIIFRLMKTHLFLFNKNANPYARQCPAKSKSANNFKYSGYNWENKHKLVLFYRNICPTNSCILFHCDLDD